MAPRSEGDDPDTQTQSTPQSDNPFIKFRQFADSQISSLLQGIVGLPSAFSKNTNNARWADFDEDMRRRDELQKRKNELRDSEARKRNEGHRKAYWEKEDDDNEMNDRIARDIPLYSPVSKSLFSHLRYAREYGAWNHDWETLDEQCSVAVFDSVNNRLSDSMQTLQNSTYRDLQISPVFRSDYSLLPYLLFSPYSPFKFMNESHRRGMGEPNDNLRYTEAFVDLILTTQGRPMGSLPLWSTYKPLPLVSPERGLVYTLWAHGVLQQSKTTRNPSILSFQQAFMSGVASANEEDGSWDPRTELDAYERFLRRASASLGAADVVESFFNEAGDWLKGALESLDSTDYKRQVEEALDFLGQKTGNEVEDERRATAASALGFLFDLVPERREEPEQRKRVAETFSETKIGKELEDARRKASTEPEKPVSTSTTSERHVEEDGSVETRVEVWKYFADGDEVESTCTTTEHITSPGGSVETKIEVWKRYADGRSTTTTTRHSEEPRHVDEGSFDEDGETSSIIKATETKKLDETKDEKIDGKKNGWFWN